VVAGTGVATIDAMTSGNRRSPRATGAIDAFRRTARARYEAFVSEL